MDFGTDTECKYAYQTLVDSNEATIEGLSKEPKTLAHALRGKGFISDELVEEIVEHQPVTRRQNAEKLYIAIKRTVKQYPHKYKDFITILKGNSLLYGDLLNLLDETYKEKERTQPILAHSFVPLWAKWQRTIIILTTLITVVVCIGICVGVYLGYFSTQDVVHNIHLFHRSKTLPYLSDNFVGRDNDVSEIMEMVNFTKKSMRIVNIVGSPGFGKSTIAIQVGHKFIDLGAHVHYINMGEFNKGNIERVLTEKVLRSASKSVKRISFERLLQWARDVDDNTLIILDNCDDVLQTQKKKFRNAVNKIMKNSQFYLKVLITSREVALYFDHSQHYKLHPLSLEASIELLNLKVNPKVHFTPEEHEQIANLTGHVPLALHVIGSLLNLPLDPPSPSTVIEELWKDPMTVLSPKDLPEEQQVNASISLSYKYLSEELKAAACYLTLFSGSFSKDAIFAIQKEYLDLELQNDQSQSMPVDLDSTALKTLLYMSLLEYNERTLRYQYHPLIRNFFLEQAKYRANRQIEVEVFVIGFRFHYARLLHKFTVQYKTKYVDSLQFLDTEKHNLQYLIDSLKWQHNLTLPHRSFVLAVDIVVDAIQSGYLTCRFAARELTGPLSNILHYLDKRVDTLHEHGHSRSVVTIDGTEWNTQRFYFTLYTELIICIGDLMAQVKGEEKAVKLYEVRRGTFEKLFSSIESRSTQEPAHYSPYINTQLQMKPGVKLIHRRFYVTLGEHYFALNQHLRVAECYSHVSEQIKKCAGVCTYYEIGHMYKDIADGEQAARFFERSLKHELHSLFDRAKILVYLYKIYSNNWPWDTDRATLTVQRLLEEYPKIMELQGKLVFEHRKTVLKAIQIFISAGEQSTADSLEEKLLSVIKNTEPELQLYPEDALEMMNIIIQGRNHSKAIEWGRLMLSPFLNQTYTNFTQQEHKSLLKIRIQLSKLYQLSDGIKEMRQVAQFILTQDINRPVYSEEFTTACQFLVLRLQLDYLYVCYGSTFTNVVPRTLAFASTCVQTFSCLAFCSVIDTFPPPDYEYQYQSGTHSTSKDVARGNDNAIIQLAESFVSDTKALVEHNWFNWVLYLVRLVFRNPLFRFIVNVTAVWFRLWFVNMILYFTTFTLVFSYLFIIEKVFKLYYRYYCIVLDSSTSMVLIYIIRAVVIMSLLVTKVMWSVMYFLSSFHLLEFGIILMYYIKIIINKKIKCMMIRMIIDTILFINGLWYVLLMIICCVYFPSFVYVPTQSYYDLVITF